MINQIKNITGIDISIYNDSFVKKTFNCQLSKTKCKSFDEYMEYLKKNPNESVTLRKALNNNFSEFFRNTLTFAFLEHSILNVLAERNAKKNNNEIRIWSAACASGHEAYSLAMICDEFTKNYNPSIRFRIFATDISETEILKAQTGVYPENALKNVSFERVKNYFTRKGDNFILSQQLKESIHFSTFDLLNKECDCPPTSIFGNFDMVFCANLLFYYNSRAQEHILNKVGNCLAGNGYLMAGEAELDILMKYNYYEIFPQSRIFKKNNRHDIKNSENSF